jgi:hypothetical protein
VLRDQLIGDVVQVCTDNLRLWADSQDVVAHPLDQSSLPARSDGAEGVVPPQNLICTDLLAVSLVWR